VSGRGRIKVTYDARADAAYIQLVDHIGIGGVAKTYACDPIEVAGMINLDFDDEDRLVGIEVLDASKRLPIELLAYEGRQDYLYDLGHLMKLYALEKRAERDDADARSEDRIFKSGELSGFHRVISLMQQQAEGFGIPLSDLRLDDIAPDRDLT
jgi:uncharacterized protein YuzE